MAARNDGRPERWLPKGGIKAPRPVGHAHAAQTKMAIGMPDGLACIWRAQQDSNLQPSD